MADMLFNLLTFFFSFGIWNENIQAQNIYIPDAAFLSALIAKGIDTNADGEIQQAEADAVTNLDVSSWGIYDMTGIEAFSNLDTLNCSGNYLSYISIPPNSTLKYLECSNNEIMDLELTGLTNLEYLGCSSNWASWSSSGMQILDVNTLANLKYLFCDYNSIDSLDVSGLQNLESLWCGQNEMKFLNVNGCVNLHELYCYTNFLTNINVSSLTNLWGIYCGENLLVNLDISNLQNLEVVQCSKNHLTNINTNNCTHLLHLWCEDNYLPNLTLTNLPQLAILECENNHLNSLNIFNCPNLYSIWCWGNQLTTLDLTTCTDLDYLRCENNNLNTLLLKNNTDEATLDFSGNPNLQYICQDASQISFVQQLLTQYGMTNVTVNNICNPTAISNKESNFILSLYPSITTENITLETKKPCIIHIFNSLGEKVLETFIEEKEEINTSYLSTGIYWVKCTNNQQVTSFIKID